MEDSSNVVINIAVNSNTGVDAVIELTASSAAPVATVAIVNDVDGPDNTNVAEQNTINSWRYHCCDSKLWLSLLSISYCCFCLVVAIIHWSSQPECQRYQLALILTLFAVSVVLLAVLLLCLYLLHKPKRYKVGYNGKLVSLKSVFDKHDDRPRFLSTMQVLLSLIIFVLTIYGAVASVSLVVESINNSADQSSGQSDNQPATACPELLVYTCLTSFLGLLAGIIVIPVMLICSRLISVNHHYNISCC